MNAIFRQMRRRDGFTINEVMCAAFIVMISVAGLSLSFIVAVRTNRFSSSYYNAACLARNRIQEAKAQPFKDLWGMAELRRRVTKDGEEPMVGTPEYAFAVYERETSVTNILSNCYEITVKVYYPISRELMSDVPIMMQTVISGQIDD